MILVDTNVWSEVPKPAPDARVLAWLKAQEDAVRLSAFVIAEIRYGTEAMPEGERHRKLETWLDGLSLFYGDRILDFGASAAHHYGVLAARERQAGRSPDIFDILIAAQALALGIPVATRNLSDFANLGVKLINPWAG